MKRSFPQSPWIQDGILAVIRAPELPHLQSNLRLPHHVLVDVDGKVQLTLSTLDSLFLYNPTSDNISVAMSSTEVHDDNSLPNAPT